MTWTKKGEILLPSNDIIGIDETKSFIEYVDKHQGFHFKRVSLRKIKYLDPIFLGWLTLLARQYALRPEIIPPTSDEYFRLFQLTYLLREDLKILTYELPSQVSRHFSPIFIIDNSTLKNLFNEPFSAIWGKFKAGFQINEFRSNFLRNLENIEQQKTKTKQKTETKTKTQKIIGLLKDIARKAGETNSLDAFEVSSLLYFLESLSPLALVRKTVDELLGKEQWPNRPQSLGILGLKAENQLTYEKKSFDFLRENILAQNPFFIYIFSLCVEFLYRL